MSRAVFGGALVVCLAASFASAQNEEALKSAFVGKVVTLKIDMPASHKGIDLRFDKEDPFNYNEHSSRVREHDAAIRQGDRVTVTQIKVKGDMIEFQLGGGGFNWSSDKTTKSFTSTPKSSRESDLEKRIKTETDKTRKRDMQEEVDDLRRRRERLDSLERAEIEAYNREASRRDQERALHAGSRFNLRFKKNVPPGALTADGVRDYLAKWVEFGGAPSAAAPAAATASHGTVTKAPREAEAPAGLDWLRRGLLRGDVEKRLGRPRKQGSCSGGDAGDCTQLTYASGSDEVEATFVDDVLLRFTVRRR
jgi:hypothetical protein